MKTELQKLKQEGHKLLNEYVELHCYRGNYYWGSKKVEINRAYEKLGTKLKESPHFGMMSTIQEVETAIKKLQMMIKKRKSKLERHGFRTNSILLREERLKALDELL